MERLGCIVVFFLLMVLAEKSTPLNSSTLSSNSTESKDGNMTKKDSDGTPTKLPVKLANNTSHELRGSPFSSPLPAPPPMHSNDSNSETKSSTTKKEPLTTKNLSNEAHNSQLAFTPAISSVISTVAPQPAPKNGTMKAPVSVHPPLGSIPSNKTRQNNETQGDNTDPIGTGESTGKVQQWCNSSNTCRDHKNLIACLQVLKNGSMSLVVYNDGEDDLAVNVRAFGSAYHEVLQLKEHQKEGIVLSAITAKVSKVILNAGNGDCILNEKKSSNWIQPYSSMIPDFPSYTSLVTPMFGAYCLALAAFSIGGIYICCKLRRRRQRHGGVQYQELEMGLPESNNPATTTIGKLDVYPTDVWDQSWDDGWEEDDEEQPRARPANGHASTALDKDGWEDKWDD